MPEYKRGLNLLCLAWRKRNRSHLEIIASVLEAAKDKNGASRYSLMKRAHSNFLEVKKYLEYLSEMGFIETDIKENLVLYKASERGLDFLRRYYALLAMLLSTRAYGNTPSQYVQVRES